jgi:hypothetical protein
VVVVVAAVAVYLNAFGHELVYDDLPLIAWNPRLGADDWLWQCVSTPYWTDGNTGLYRPLTLLSLAVNFKLTGLATWSYTSVNVLLHAATSLLVALLARATGARVAVATAAGLVFAVHPVHTEAVTWIAGRAEVLCGAFSMLALYCHWRGPERDVWRVGAAAAFACALGAKEHALTLLGVAPALDLLLRRGPWRARLGAHILPAYVPFALLASLVLGLRVVVLGDVALGPRFVVPLDNPLVAPVTSALGNDYGATTGERLLSAVALWGEHLRLLAWPRVLSADYSYAQWPVLRTASDGRFAPGLLTLALTLGGAWSLRRRAPLASFGLAAFFLTSLVTAQVLKPTGTIYAERLLYLPSVGFALVLGAAFGRAWAWPRTRALAGVVLVALLSLGALRTHARNQVWTNRRTLWEATVLTSPNSARAHAKLGSTYLEAAEALPAEQAGLRRSLYKASAAHMERSLDIYPERAGVNVGLVVALFSLEEHERAWAPLERLQRLPPADLTALRRWEGAPGAGSSPAEVRALRLLRDLRARRSAE